MEKISEKIMYEGKWLSFVEITWRHEDGSIHVWESVRRKLKNAIVIIPRLVPSNRFVLIKEYRAAVANFVIEFPAGLVEYDNIEEEALRELEEETGYVGTIREVSSLIDMNSAMTDATFQVAFVDIDETLEVNKNPQQKLDGAENIEVFTVAEEELSQFFKEMKDSGAHFVPSVWYYFSGLLGRPVL